MAALAIVLTLRSAIAVLPPGEWWQALSNPDTADMGDLLLHYSVAPRFFASLLVGAGLTVAAILFQSVLRNPAAESSTLGISAGAFLSLAVCGVFMPAVLDGHRTLAAGLGGAAAGALVLGLSWRSRFDPKVLLLCGLLVNLYAGALNTLLILSNGGLIHLFIWESGSLSMQDWGVVTMLVPNVLACWIIAMFLCRPLSVLGLSDEAAGSLGLSPKLLRWLAMILGTWLTAVCVAGVGVIGFIGLAAPEIVRQLGATKIRSQLLAAPVLGGCLLCSADAFFHWIPTPAEIPAGAAVALLGAPLLLWISSRREMQASRTIELSESLRRRSVSLKPATAVLFASFVLVLIALSIFVGRGLGGWAVGGLHSLDATFFWRGPRLVVAVAAGIMLAVSGVLVQRLTGNPMASPELLGTSSGAAIAVVLVAIMFPSEPRWMGMLAAAGGSLLVLFLVIILGLRHAFAPDRIVIVGLSIATLFSAGISILLTSGDTRMYSLLDWLSGSTYLSTPSDAYLFSGLAFAAFVFVIPMARWLDILPLGSGTATGVGVSLTLTRLIILMVSSIFVGASVLAAGPLSFVGLIAPHAARMCGARHALVQIVLAAAIGGSLMGVADFIGRVAFVPRQMPAGLAATLIGGAYVLWLMRKRKLQD